MRGIHQQGNRQLPQMRRGYHMGQLSKALSARNQAAAGSIGADPGEGMEIVPSVAYTCIYSASD